MLGIHKELERLKNINVRYMRPQFTHRKKEKSFIKDGFSSGTISKCLNRFLDKSGVTAQRIRLTTNKKFIATQT